MLENWLDRIRHALLKRLRPGRDQPELLDLIGRAESIRSDEHRRMLEQLAAFNDVRVRELMVPRSDMQAIEAHISLDEAIKCFADSGRTRLPVYQDDLDNIQGVVHAWDAYAAIAKGETPGLSELLRPCLRVPESQIALGLLSLMKQEGVHIAIALDEYGGTAGMLTLSDLLSEIVGSMGEATDAGDEAECERLADGELLVHARMHVEDLEEELGRSLPEGDFDTVGGFITGQLGRIPVRGEHLSMAGLDIHILEAEPRRVLKVRITAPADAQTA